METKSNTKGSKMAKLSVSELFARESERVAKVAHATAKQVNGVSGREYQGFNRINLYLVAKEKSFSNTWYLFDQAKEKGLFVKKGEHGTPVFNHKLVDREEGRKEKVLSYYLVFNADQLTTERPEDEFKEEIEEEIARNDVF